MSLDYDKLIYAASLAPSPDNNSPWRFEILYEGLKVKLPETISFEPDVRRSLDYISLGAALRNIILEAEAQGYSTKIEYSELHKHQCQARLYFTKTTSHTSSHYHSLFTRRTDRSFYKKQPLPQEFFTEVDALCAADKHSIHMFDSRNGNSDIDFWAHIIGRLEQIRFSTPVFHTHLFQVLKFSLKEIEKSRYGLFIQSLQLPPFAATLLKLMRSWRFTQFLNHLGLSKALAFSTDQQMRSAAGVCVLAGDINSSKCLIQTGLLLQTIWLIAEKHGLSIHPQGHLSIFYQMQESPHFTARQKETTRKCIELCKNKLNRSDNAIPIIVFRIGYGTRNSSPCFRARIQDLCSGN